MSFPAGLIDSKTWTLALHRLAKACKAPVTENFFDCLLISALISSRSSAAKRFGTSPEFAMLLTSSKEPSQDPASATVRARIYG
jgi:hypothetical protein